MVGELSRELNKKGHLRSQGERKRGGTVERRTENRTSARQDLVSQSKNFDF